MGVTVTVKCPQEIKVTITFEPDQTVLQLKEAISKELESTAIPTPANQQRLIYSGRILKDDELLSIYKIQEGNTLHMVKGAAPKAAPSTSTTATPSAESSTTPAPVSTTTSSSIPTPATGGTNINPLPNPFANPFAAFGGGAGGNSFGGANPFAAMGGGMPPMGPMADPNMMASLLQNPQVSNSVAQMMANPQFVDAMINSNPQLAGMMTPEMRAMMSSPEFARMMSDPNVVRQAMAMAPLLQGAGGAGSMGANPLGGFGGFNPAVDLSNNNNSTGTTASPTGTTNPSTPGSMQPFAPNPALLQMLLGGGGPFGAAAGGAAATGGRPPEEVYEVQLRQLQEMGFFSAAENLRALTMTGGNVDAAVEWLLSHPPSAR